MSRAATMGTGAPHTDGPGADWSRDRPRDQSRDGMFDGGPEDVVDESLADPLVRPFLVTGGRTRPSTDGLRIESLLQSRRRRNREARFEAEQIVALCQHPASLAEIAAVIGLPLGVARVLVADLIADGTLEQVEQVDPGDLSVGLLERIVARVRAL